MTVADWLLDSDPALRWQVMRDLTDESDQAVTAERARVATEGWGASLLELQEPDGSWDGGTYRPGWVDDSKPFFDAWTATHYSLQLLNLLGPHPSAPPVQNAISLVAANVRWDANDAPYFDGETEECVNGIALTTGVYFGQDVDGIVDRLLEDRLSDGGWNCYRQDGATVSSFHSTICVLEGLLAWEQAGGSSKAVASARATGEEYLLERKLFRSKSAGVVVDPRFTMFAFPYYWYYDILRALDYFRLTGAKPDDRLAEAIDLIESKRDQQGRWSLDMRHRGPTHFRVDGGEGAPSRWNTLRAMRTLDWARRS